MHGWTLPGQQYQDAHKKHLIAVLKQPLDEYFYLHMSGCPDLGPAGRQGGRLYSETQLQDVSEPGEADLRRRLLNMERRYWLSKRSRQLAA